MRMRRKRHLDERIKECSDVLLVKDFLTADTRRLIDDKSKIIDLGDVFGNGNPIYIDLGCGLGAFALKYARRNPNVNILAVERISNVIITAMENAKKENLPNLKFMNIPAECLPMYIADGAVEKIFLNFSTPLPKAGYIKQRLTHPRFISVYSRLLKEGGEVIQKTDSMAFFEYSIESFSSCGYILKDISLDLHNSRFADENIVTEYERNFSEKGMPIYRLVAEKKNQGVGIL